MGTYTGSDKRLQYLFQNGGGGGSSSLAGLSDVNLSSPTDGQILEYDAANQEWINANNSGGGGGDNIIGAFIDTSNIIVPSTSITSGTQFSYTATEDCFFIIHFYLPSNVSVTFYIDGVAVQGYYLNVSASWQYIGNDQMFPLKKGHVISFTYPSSSPANANYSVFGVQSGSVFVGLADCYSTEERQVGCFVDGKPLYQKTLFLEGAIPRNTWTNHNISDVDKIWVYDSFGKRSTDYRYNGINYFASDDYMAIAINRTQIYIGYPTTTPMTNGYITVRYTKTTDTAGSGTWTPSGAVAEHYSTDEQVIGTWIDGSTLYRKVLTIPISSKSVDYDISNMNVDKMINLYGATASSHLPFAIVHNSGSLSYSIGLNYGNNVIQIRFGNDRSIETPCYIVCEYTKSS